MILSVIKDAVSIENIQRWSIILSGISQLFHFHIFSSTDITFSLNRFINISCTTDKLFIFTYLQTNSFFQYSGFTEVLDILMNMLWLMFTIPSACILQTGAKIQAFKEHVTQMYSTSVRRKERNRLEIHIVACRAVTG
jgi:citrate lyase synthetase